MTRTMSQKQGIMDGLVGKPFVLLPGKPADHVVCGEDKSDGTKYRAAGVMQVFNDMLLMDAIEGSGTYERMCSRRNAAFLEVAVRLYGMSCKDALEWWLKIPNLKRPWEWPSDGVTQ